MCRACTLWMLTSFLYSRSIIYIPIPKKGKARQCSNCCTIALVLHSRKVMLSILQARIQQYVNRELDNQAVFRKGRGTRDEVANIGWIIEKAREFQKDIYFCFIEYAKAFDCVDHNKLEYQTTLPASWEIYMQVKKQQLELGMEQWASSKLEREYVKAVYCHPGYLTYMQSTLWEMLGWMKRKLESGIKIAGRNINNLRYADDTALTAESKEELKSFLMKVKNESAKLALNSTFKKGRSWHPIPSLHANRWGNNGNSEIIYFFGLQNHCRWWPRPWN